ncbi:hypothetical protein DL240_10770 [Lujinxingia litoralis]|uniref:Uncharacterized protein n=2 Tax=Lujinxingia litoralis TaxID=2211119 RepID=A0A328C7D9_9DELT|nr:hypothetical protein DL240_10770 [Lujinxingia litoralis]
MVQTRVKVGAVLLAGLLMIGGCSSEEASGGPKGPKGPKMGGNVTRVSVETVPVAQGEFAVQGDFAGEFQSEGMAELSAEVAGRVTTLNVNIGDAVEEGQVLAEVDATPTRQRVRELGASVQMSRASLEEARVNLANLRRDLERKEPLLSRQMITEREVEELRSQVSAAEQRVAVAEATIAQNQARQASAREDLSNTKIRAPFAGLIGERYVDRGSYVSPGQTVFRVVDDGDLYISVRIPERDAARVATDTPVTIRVGALGSAPLKGKILRIAPALDPATRSLRVDVVLNEEHPGIRPGMYARVSLELGRAEDALTLMSQAILRQVDGAPYVWKVVDGAAQRQEVVLGLVGRERTQIIEGLQAGTPVVLRGHEKLKDGVEVRDISVGGGAGEEASP